VPGNLEIEVKPISKYSLLTPSSRAGNSQSSVSKNEIHIARIVRIRGEEEENPRGE
jgi:hypothetical protein